MKVQGLKKNYGKSTVVDNVSFEIHKGMVTSFIGPNGAGKSTVIGMISRLVAKDQGLISFHGKELEKWNSKELAKHLAILTQSNQIQMKLTVEELVTFGRFPHCGGRLSGEDEGKISQAITYMELDEFRNRFIDELSGGQRQRAYIAMVIAQDTEYVLLDEPTNNLDIYHAANLMKIVRRLCDELGKTVIMVLHEINYAAFYSDYICAFKEGRIKKYGTVKEVYQMNTILKLEHIQKYYGNEGNITKAIKDISFSVEAGEFLGIMGASGSGKTTLLNCISTIDTVSAGHIFLDGTDITEIKPKSLARFRRENLGFIFQDFNLLDTLTISENIALALAINKVPAGSVESRILDIAGKLNISDILNKYPYQVSGGQKQRCACARAIINNPKLLLADEPTGALDSHSSQMLLSTIQSINEQLRATILMVTHDAFTASYANRILFLKDGEIFMELRKGNDSRSAFFDKILNVLTMIGGGQSHVC